MSRSFRNPPVVETVLSIQFEELENFRNIHFGKFHAQIESDFSNSEDQPRLPRIFESFPLVPKLNRIQLQQSGGEPNRVWYRSARENSLMLQLQPDRFSLNWCKREGQSYPRYTAYRPEFFRGFGQFREFAEQSGLGPVLPTLCEVTYVNHIIPNDGESVSDCCAAVMAGLEWVSVDGWLQQPPESFSFNRTFPIQTNKGRLYVELNAGNNGECDIVQAKITARTICEQGSDASIELDLAHDWVVKSFVSLTTDDARKVRWGEVT